MLTKSITGPDSVHYFPSGLMMTTTDEGPRTFKSNETQKRSLLFRGSITGSVPGSRSGSRPIAQISLSGAQRI